MATETKVVVAPVEDKAEGNTLVMGFTPFVTQSAAASAFPYHSVKQQRKDMQTLLTM